MPDPYDDALLDYEGALKEPNHFQNILEKAANVIKNDFMPSQSSNPFMQGVQSTMQGLKTQPGLGPYMVGHDIKSDMAQNLAGNPVGGVALDMISDPETLIGAKGISSSIGDMGKGLVGVVKGLKGRSAVKGGTEIQQGVRNSVMSKFLGRTKSFDEALSNLPETTHDVTIELNQAKNMAETNPAIKNAIDNSPIAKKLLYGNESGVGKMVDEFGRSLSEQVANQSDKIVSTRDLQNLRNELGKGFDYSDPGHDWNLGRLLGDLRLNQAAPFPEEMGAMAKSYKDTINNFNVVKPYLRESRLGGAILKGFGGEGGAEVRNSLNYFLGEKGKDINNIYQSGQTMNKLKEAGTKGAVSLAGGAVIKKLFGL